MAKSLGIFASSDRHLDKIIKLCKAAKKKKVSVTIFFTHRGVLSTRDSRFSQLETLAHLSICYAGFEDRGFKPPVPGILEKDYATQSRHCDLIKNCDRYVVF